MRQHGERGRIHTYLTGTWKHSPMMSQDVVKMCFVWSFEAEIYTFCRLSHEAFVFWNAPQIEDGCLHNHSVLVRFTFCYSSQVFKYHTGCTKTFISECFLVFLKASFLEDRKPNQTQKGFGFDSPERCYRKLLLASPMCQPRKDWPRFIHLTPGED